MRKVTIVGSGIVGSSWAVIFARGGYTVSLYDNDEGRLQGATTAIKSKLAQLKDNSLLADSTESVMERVSVHQDLEEALKDAIYVQECIPEVLEMKQAIFQQLDSIVPPSTILASSTSNIPASKFTESLANRDRCIVAHPVNPPHLIPVVEVVPSPWTTPEIAQKTINILKEVGQKPVLLHKEVPGFVINRLQYALLAECFRLVEDGILSPGDVDVALTYGLAPRWSFMGPIQTIDLNAPKGVQEYCERYLGGITSVLKGQDNQRNFGSGMVESLVQHQRSLYDESDVPQAIAWRDARLMALLRHQAECATIDQMFPHKG